MKTIKSVKPIGRKEVYDISVKDAEHYVLENGVVTHNTGIYYSASTIFFMGRQQEKDGKEVAGYNFMLGIEKSRFVKEKTRLPLNVTWENGVNKWSGLLEIGLALGWVIKPKNGWYQAVDKTTGELMYGTPDKEKSFRLKDTSNADFWIPLFKAGFAAEIEERYKIQAVGFTSEADDEDSENPLEVPHIDFDDIEAGQAVPDDEDLSDLGKELADVIKDK